MDNFLHYLPEGAKAEINGNVIAFEVAANKIEHIIANLCVDEGLTLAMIDATDERAKCKCFKVWYVFSLPGGAFVVPYIRIARSRQFPSVAHIAPAMGWCERKIKDMFGLHPSGVDVDDRRLLLHENWPDDNYPLCKNFNANAKPKVVKGKYVFHEVEGEGIYEIPVGPIHAGIIEPGHFRFSMAGEQIVLLEARLGYVHKGHEKLFEVLSLDQKVRLSEKISGDSSFSHSLAFCQAIESLSGIEVTERAKYLRTIYSELERLACHIGDIGFIMLDTGFNFGGSNGQRLREAIMQINQRITGSRFLRGVNEIGGVSKDIQKSDYAKLAAELKKWLKDANEVIDIALNSSTFMNRVKTTGVLNPVVAKDYGAVGYAARATGIKVDARVDHPYAAYDKVKLGKIAVYPDGDVYSRFCVRVDEVRASVDMICRALRSMPDGQTLVHKKDLKLRPNSVAIGCTEGWRGEIIHFVSTDQEGNIARAAVRDPSCINWQLVGYSGQDNLVLDFPLINKSYNLSYTGNDL